MKSCPGSLSAKNFVLCSIVRPAGITRTGRVTGMSERVSGLLMKLSRPSLNTLSASSGSGVSDVGLSRLGIRSCWDDSGRIFGIGENKDAGEGDDCVFTGLKDDDCVVAGLNAKDDEVTGENGSLFEFVGLGVV